MARDAVPAYNAGYALAIADIFPDLEIGSDLKRINN
jgi:hypothetical protein